MKTYIVDISFELESDESKEELMHRICEEHPTCRELNIQEGDFVMTSPRLKEKVIERSRRGY